MPCVVNAALICPVFPVRPCLLCPLWPSGGQAVVPISGSYRLYLEDDDSRETEAIGLSWRRSLALKTRPHYTGHLNPVHTKGFRYLCLSLARWLVPSMGVFCFRQVFWNPSIRPHHDQCRLRSSRWGSGRSVGLP